MARRTLPALAALALAVLLMAGCGERAEPAGVLGSPYPVTVRGAGDTPTRLVQAPARIVALDAGSAELIDALGAGERLVGAPAGVAIGGGIAPEEVVKATGQIDVDAVVRLAPDLVVTTPDTSRVEVSQVERRTGALVYVQPSRTVEDVERAAIELGFIVGRPVEARQLAGSLQDAVARIEGRLAGVEPVSVFIDTGFLITASDQSLLGDLVRLAKGTNVAGGAEALGPYSLAELQAHDPGVYLATSDSRVSLDSLRRDPTTASLAAVRDGRVVVLPVDLVTRAGPRIASALEAIAVALHPDAFR